MCMNPYEVFGIFGSGGVASSLPQRHAAELGGSSGHAPGSLVIFGRAHGTGEARPK